MTSSAHPGKAGKWPWACSALSAGVSTLGQQMQFQNELDEVVRVGQSQRRGKGSRHPPAHRRPAHAELKIMRYNSMRMLSGPERQRRLAAEGGADLQAVLGHLAPQPG